MPLRILIVDDDKHTCRILKTLLQRDPALAAKGVEVVLAGDGEKGLLALAEGPFDLVISDLLMPRMDGFAFCRELRRHPHGEQVPLLVSSAVYKDPITLRKLKTEVGAEFFAKPFQVGEMIRAVRRLLGLDNADAEVAAPQVPQIGDAGNLLDRPLPCLLLDLFETGSSCCLVLQRGELVRRVHLLFGHIIAVESNSRTDALGGFLLDQGVISETQLCDALEASRSARKRLGQVLVERGILNETELFLHMEDQLRSRTAALFQLRTGTWQRQPLGPVYERITPQGGTPLLVFAALRDTIFPDGIGEQRERLTARLYPLERASTLREPFEHIFGPGSLDLLEDRPLVAKLLSELNPVARETLMIRIQAMLACRLCSAEHLDAPGPRNGRHSRWPRQPQDRRPRPRPWPTGRAEPVANVYAAPASYDIGKGAATQLDPRHRELLAEYLAVGGRDLYDLLGIPRDAEQVNIHSAYHATMERLSPDRFSDVELGADYGKISELRERYRHAYSVLSSPLRRAAYDRELHEADQMRPRLIEAELLFRQAEARVSQGELILALPLAVRAAELAPDQADFHALLGWLRFLHERHAGAEPQQAAQAARPHLLRALSIDEDHVSAHASSGHIAVALGEDEVAAGHFDRVLDLSPDRKDALCALERVLGRLGQWERLARRYHRMLRRYAGRQRAFDSAQHSGAPFTDSAQHSGAPFTDSARLQSIDSQAIVLRKLADLYEHQLRDADAGHKLRAALAELTARAAASPPTDPAAQPVQLGA